MSGDDPLNNSSDSLYKQVRVSNSIKNWNLVKEDKTNLSFFKPELSLEPQLRMAFGGIDDSFIHQFNLLPEFNMVLKKGLSLKAQFIFPISDEFEIKDQKYIRPGLINLNQYFRLPNNFFVGLTIGYFTNNSYGSEVELSKFLFNGNLLIQGKLGYTGYASYPIINAANEPVKGWYYSMPYYFDFSSSVEYRFSEYDLLVKAEVGKYLYETKAIQLEIKRQFRELDLSFFSQLINTRFNFGFKLEIPILPKKYPNFNHWVLRPSKSFSWSYNATNNYLIKYKTGNSINSFINKLNPIFIQNQLNK